MASELNINASLSFSKNGASYQRQASGTVDVAGSYYSGNIKSIPTTDTQLPLGDVATNGYVFLKNLDATNYIVVGSDGLVYPVKLLKGEFALFRFNGAAIHCKSDTAACRLEFGIIEA